MTHEQGHEPQDIATALLTDAFLALLVQPCRFPPTQKLARTPGTGRCVHKCNRVSGKDWAKADIQALQQSRQDSPLAHACSLRSTVVSSSSEAPAAAAPPERAPAGPTTRPGTPGLVRSTSTSSQRHGHPCTSSQPTRRPMSRRRINWNDSSSILRRGSPPFLPRHQSSREPLSCLKNAALVLQSDDPK